MASNVKKWSAEFLGTFWLTFGGCGSAVLAAAFPGVGIGLLGVFLAFGLTVLTGVYAFGPVSGGHFNPAVSVGLAVAGRRAPGASAWPSCQATSLPRCWASSWQRRRCTSLPVARLVPM